MRLKSLLFTLLILACFSTAKAITVEIGTEYGYDPTQMHSGLPAKTSEHYSVSQQIYNASEIGRAGYITSITFYCDHGYFPLMIDIYMKHTTQTSFNDKTDWLTVEENDKVCHIDTIALGLEQWFTMKFDRPFYYNGVDNLALIFHNGSKKAGGMLSCPYFPTTECQAIYFAYYRDFDINNPTNDTGSSIKYLDTKMQLKLEMYDADQVDDGQCFVGRGPDVYKDFLPTTSFYKYSITQQIYTADEISDTGEARLINSISLYNAGREKTRKISLWFFPTEKSSFDTFGDWIDLPGGKPLFEGEVTFYEDNWTVIPFSRPVLSNGTDNFVLCVNDETGSFQYGGQLSFLSYETTESQQMNMHGDTQPFNPADIKSYSGYYGDKVKNKLLFNNESDLSLIPRPTEIHVDALPTVATVTWSSEGSYWELQYKADSETEWHKLNATEKSCEITGLMPKTKYRVRIRNINNGASYWLSTEFTTLDNMPTDITKAPLAKSCTIRWTGYSDSYDVLYREASDEPSFFEDFEGGFAAKGWSVNTIGQARNDGQGWFTEDVTLRSTEEATYTNYSGSKCAVAESWASGVGGMEADNWLISPLVDLGGTLKFWQWTSDSYADSYEVMVTAREVINFTTVRPLSPGARGWSQVVADLSEFQGKQGFIAIHHKCTDKMWLFIDDFAIYPAEPWQKVTTTEQEVTLTNLKPTTKYEYKIVGHQTGYEDVSTDIFAFTTGVWQPVIMNIDIVPDVTSAEVDWVGNSESYEVEYREAGATSEPFFDDFENGLADKGWKVYTQGETTGGEGWFTGSILDMGVAELNHSGKNSAIAESWSKETNGLAADNWLVTPQVNLGGTLRFWQWIRGDYPDSFEVLLSTTGDAIEDFTTTLRPLGPGLNRWNEVVIDLSAYEGLQGYIAIHHKCTDMFWMAIDDFGIYPVEGWTKVATTECQVTLTDLQPETTYELRITGFSDGEAEIVSDIVSFTTEAVPGPIDLVLDCKGSNSETIQANDGASVNATIANLTLKKDGKWQAVCLPFDVDVENSPLAGADVRTLESVTVTNAVCTLDCPTPQTTMEANKPYILRWDEGEDIVNPVFEDVTIKFVRMDDSGQWLKIEGAGYFGARYDYIGIMPDMLYLGDESPILTKTDTSIELHAFEGFFFIYTSIQSVASVFVLNTGYEDELITGIAGVNANADSDAIYNLAGQRISKTQKGVNIVGSKKILVK